MTDAKDFSEYKIPYQEVEIIILRNLHKFQKQSTSSTR